VKKNTPPYKIISNKTLLFLAVNPKIKLDSMKGIGKWMLKQAGKDLTDALRKGINADPIFLPKLPRRPSWSKSANSRLTVLKDWRLRKGKELSLDPAILWPAASFQRIARSPALFSDELSDKNNSDVRNWQKNLFAKELNNLVKTF